MQSYQRKGSIKVFCDQKHKQRQDNPSLRLDRNCAILSAAAAKMRVSALFAVNIIK